MIIPRMVSGVNVEKKTIEAIMALPGVAKKDLKVTVSKSGFCVFYPDDDGTKVHRCYSFMHPVKPEKAKVRYKEGRLEFKVPITEEVFGREVKVE